MSTDTKLLAAQAANKRLRETLQSFCTKPIDGWRVEQLSAVAALATTDDTVELDALIADAEKRGYQAAIAAIREGGAHAVLQVGSNPRFIDCIHRGVALPADQFLWPEETRMPSLTLVPLYKLPDDLT